MRNESDVCYVRNERDGHNERTGETKGQAGDGVNGTSPRCHGSRVASKSSFVKNIAFADGVASFLQAGLLLPRAASSLLRAHFVTCRSSSGK